MTRFAIAGIVVAALAAGGYAVLRTAGPEIFVDETAADGSADEAAEPAPVILWPESKEEKEEEEPQRPLATDLELELDPIPPGLDPRTALSDRPHLDLELKSRTIPRPEIETLNLFDPRYGTRGVVQRQWLSERFGVQGGFGYSQNEEDAEERDMAVGLGFVLIY